MGIFAERGNYWDRATLTGPGPEAGGVGSTPGRHNDRDRKGIGKHAWRVVRKTEFRGTTRHQVKSSAPATPPHNTPYPTAVGRRPGLQEGMGWTGERWVDFSS